MMRVDARATLPPSVLQGIAEEIQDHLLQQDDIALARGEGASFDVYGMPPELGAQLIAAFAQDMSEIDRLHAERLASELQELEQVVDQLVHAFDIVAGVLQQSSGIGVRSVSVRRPKNPPAARGGARGSREAE